LAITGAERRHISVTARRKWQLAHGGRQKGRGVARLRSVPRPGVRMRGDATTDASQRPKHGDPRRATPVGIDLADWPAR
jgi:hypothetical protein